jgi:glucan 1,3-beta-glucosidase
MDSRTFCTALGSEEANKQLRRHWASWVTEEEVSALPGLGVDTIRLPVADWMYVNYEPFGTCWDGSLKEVKRLLDLCTKYNIRVIMDIHGMKDSQNGCDNSGQARNVKWIQSNGTVARFEHYETIGAYWIGDYNITTRTYNSINQNNIKHSLEVVRRIVDMYKDEPAVVGLEPGK